MPPPSPNSSPANPGHLWPAHARNPADCARVRDDWSTPIEVQIEHLACCCPRSRRDLLLAINNKLTLPYGTNYDDYTVRHNLLHDQERRLSILAHSDYDRGPDCVECGYSLGRRYRCDDHLLCPRCCGRRGYELVEEFGGA